MSSLDVQPSNKPRYIQKLSRKSSKTSPPTALWLLQSLQATCLPPPGRFILDNGWDRENRMEPATDGNDDMWYMQNLPQP